MFSRLFRPNPLDAILKKLVQHNQSRLLLVWNRGLGDIALGLYGVVHRIREFIPHASVTILTRPHLAEGFALLEGVTVLVDPNWNRGDLVCIQEALAKHQLTPNMFDEVLEWIDITKWLKGQLGQLVPKLQWKKEWDSLSNRFDLAEGEEYIAAQVQTETSVFYDRNRDWPMSHWRALFSRLVKQDKKILLFGLEQTCAFLMNGVIDLRGKTSVLDMLALLKNRCSALIAPDSGVLSTIYFLNAAFPLKVVSLWGSPNWGVLRQKVASPNRQLEHVPLIGKGRNVAQISVDTVYEALVCTATHTP